MKQMRAFAVLAGLSMMLIILAGCSGTLAPEERLAEYTSLWNKQDFKQMYEQYVSESGKQQYKIEDFADRYQTVYEDLEVKNLKVRMLEGEEKDWGDARTAELPIEVKMNTLAGPIEFEKKVTMKLEEREGEENWYVDWNPSYIFPQLEPGDKIRVETMDGKRGEIVDRNGNSLAVNGKVYEIGIKAGEVEAQNKQKIASLLGITEEYIETQLNQSWVQPGYFVPLKDLSNADEEKLKQLMAIPGVQAKGKEMRDYPYGEALGHLTGYVGQINSEEYEKLKDKGYSQQDRIGKRGLEQLLEETLRESDGKRIYIEKKEGDPVVLAEKPAKDGKNVQLTIDAELQKVIFEQLGGRPGTAAAVDPKTGETLALVSSPSFNPNEFAAGISSSRYAELEKDPNKPLLNRFAATFSPGSTIKPVTAAIGLKSGKLDPNQERPIQGLRWQKDQSWGNYRVTRVKDIGQPVNLQEALVYSDNIYFAQAALDMGEETMVKGFEAFGFGEKLPIGYPIRSSQISNDGKLGKETLLSDTSYGQGEMLVSMVHLASMYAGIINNGVMMEPLLYETDQQNPWKKGLVTEDQAKRLQQNMRLVIEKGTAQAANIEG
ncbi:MAG TPA: penicillin-binding transpeptidase domain-containing protein, partial [Chondromyces sp.]|nr:penicillin-binding transpeptidase domain-containing protein [Chondromyces sp.]